MPDYDPTAYGAAVADVYDELYGDDVFDTEGAIHQLRQLAGDGPVLELGIGTGRLALPLVAGGLRVHGVDASADMLDRLRAKPGAASWWRRSSPIRRALPRARVSGCGP